MYNGQPPFRPPPGNLPPFPPNRPPAPGQTPSQFPPFRPPPPGSFIPPPFPPNFAPGSRPPPPISPSGPGGPGYNSPGAASSNGLPFRPPPSGPAGMGLNQYPPPRPAHPGLGLPPPPAGLPQAPRFEGLPLAQSPNGAAGTGTPPGFVRDVKTTSVFVGSIAPGIMDDTLKNLLNACGPLHELKRVSGASGKPQAFGFAAYENPEVVLRCIRCLNGVELPDLSPEGRRDGKKKALVVKADQKTQEFLEEFESTLGRSDNDEEADAATRKSIAHIVALLTDPNAQHPDAPAKQGGGGGDSPLQVIVPEHLQDLKEGDLPENQRVAVLDQIAIFRVAAAKREKEKKAIEDERERYRMMQQQQANRTPAVNPNANYGYGNNRSLAKQQQQAWQNQNQHQSPITPQQGQQTPVPGQQQNGAGPSRVRDPQGYDKPVGFVAAQSAEGKVDSGRTDEEEEELRRQRKQREKDIALRDAERRVEHRERMRIDALNRELAQRKAHDDLIERNRRRLTEQYENWDDDEIIEKGRELFYTDRATWRARRQRIRQQEYQDDVRDRQQEEDELQALERESEEFLKKQMAELAELENEQKAKGLLTEDAAPIRLNIQPTTIDVKPKEEVKPVIANKPKPVILAGDDEEENEKKKKRTLIRLDADTDGNDGLTEAQRLAKRNAKLLEIKKTLPQSKRDIFRAGIDWAAVHDSTIRDKIKPFVESQIKQFLGELDQDLVEFVLEHLKDKKGSDDLVDGLEPILAEDAESFVLQLWKLLIFESEAYKVGLSTGSMMP
ncbi:hypothetical protein I302_102436 [Kwoniella bestiolae CBS 10118]|uniref:PWI domain-containing protein n=1 Tax=Kwoniella bestiolae CBS 10118 TaxID=1296100 RepID=A0A1B9GF50_9TREE|nr:hypothetical protein I302_01127 [Kwoniella bestiolae CBS 10118]OCF29618.1 hypothetical protein I302_01127 [Kwoniella bestiolae CBS 10118]